MARLQRRLDPPRFERLARAVLGLFGAVERLRVLNQKQLWVATR
jgi:hypothetical protein